MSHPRRNPRPAYRRPCQALLVLTLLLAAGAGAAAPADHLILSEVRTSDVNAPPRPSSSTYIEIVNPTAGDIDLSDVYLTDATAVTNGLGYWFIAGPDPVGTSGGGTAGDFHGRFPAGYVIAAGDTIAVSVTGSGSYEVAYGQLPDFELYEDGLVLDQVPELVEAFPGSINAGTLVGGSNQIDLVDNAESVVLYTWDGAGDLVSDLDYVRWGATTFTDIAVDKSGVTVGAGTYQADTPANSQETASAAALSFGQSYGRLSADEGTESASGGNGIGGHDETSENFSATWQVGSQTPPQAPALFHATAPVVTGIAVDPVTPFDGASAEVAVTVVSFSAVTGVAFHYQVDGGAFTDVAGVETQTGVWALTVPAQTEGAAVAWYAEITNADGVTTTAPAAAPRFTRGWTVLAAPEPKPLLTEICTKGSEAEFVEIWNPGVQDLDLSDYYLTDAIYFPNLTGYWNLGGGVLDADTIGGGAFTDFNARFPDGFTIAAGDTIVVSVAGSAGFASTYGFLPDLELFEDDVFPDSVEDMRWIFGDETNNSIINRTGSADGQPSTPTLTNGGEPVILYYWEAGEDLVVDVDIFEWYVSGSTSFQFVKNGISVGSSTYQPDRAIANQMPFPSEHDFEGSYQRADVTEGDQVLTGGNGIDGRDELSENWSQTFVADVADPSRPAGAVVTGGGSIELVVEAKTFLPRLGEVFPIRFVSKPRSETRLRLYDLEGRLVLTLFDSRFNGPPSVVPGVYTTTVWKGLDETFQFVKGGMYIVHLSVVDGDSGDEEIKTAPVVVATRLSN